MTPEECKFFDLMVRLVEDFEARTYPMRDVPPHRVIRHLMEARGLSQADLLPVCGGRGRVSEVVNGKRGISKAQAKMLAEFFGVSADMFI